MNPENGSPTCDACHTDCNEDEMYSVVIHWDADTDYNQLSMCSDCAVLYARVAKEIYNPLGKQITPFVSIGWTIE